MCIINDKYIVLKNIAHFKLSVYLATRTVGFWTISGFMVAIKIAPLDHSWHS